MTLTPKMLRAIILALDHANVVCPMTPRSRAANRKARLWALEQLDNLKAKKTEEESR